MLNALDRLSGGISRWWPVVLTIGVGLSLWAPPLQLLGGAFWHLLRHPADASALWRTDTPARSLLFNTVVLGVLTSLLALLFGFPVGVALNRAPRKVRPLLAVLCAIPLAVPPVVLATAWLDITRTPPARSMAAVAATAPAATSPLWLSALVLALSFFPVAALSVAAALGNISHANEEAARSMSKPWPVWQRVLVPQLASALWGALGAVFLLAIWEMGAPDLLDARTYSVEIYRNLAADDALDAAGKNVRAALASLPMFALGAPALWLVARSLPRLVASTPDTKRYLSSFTRRENLLLAGVASLVLLVSPVAPLGVMFSILGTPHNALHIMREAWNDNSVEIGNTAVLSTVCAMLVVLVSFVCVASWRGWSARGQRVALWLCATPLLVAPILHGVALVAFWNAPQFALINGTIAPTGIASIDPAIDWCSRYALPLVGLLSRFLPLGLVLLYHAARRIDDSVLEAAQNLGAKPARTNWTILWPLLREPLAAVFALMWALSAAEISVSVLTQQPGGQPLTLPIFQLMHIFALDKVAALCLTLAAMSSAVFLLCGALALWRNPAR